MTPIPVKRSDASPTPKPIPKLIALSVPSLLPPVGAAVADEVKALAAEEMELEILVADDVNVAAEEVDELEITGSDEFYN
jgi:hypothetical protein